MSVDIATPAAALDLPVAPERLHRFTLDQYHALIESGALRPSDRMVLLDGLLVDKPTKKPGHSNACGAGFLALVAASPAGWHVRQEDPITLTADPPRPGSEPDPDD